MASLWTWERSGGALYKYFRALIYCLYCLQTDLVCQNIIKTWHATRLTDYYSLHSSGEFIIWIFPSASVADGILCFLIMDIFY